MSHNPQTHTKTYQESSSYQRGPDGHVVGEYHAQKAVDGHIVQKQDYVDRDGRIQAIGNSTGATTHTGVQSIGHGFGSAPQVGSYGLSQGLTQGYNQGVGSSLSTNYGTTGTQGTTFSQSGTHLGSTGLNSSYAGQGTSISSQPKVHTSAYTESSSYKRGPDGHYVDEHHVRQAVDGKIVQKQDYVDRDGRIQAIGG